MKKNKCLSVISLALIIMMTGCSTRTSKDKTNIDEPTPSVNEQVSQIAPEAWESISGTFVRDKSSQYNNGVLQLKYLSNNNVLFEFRLMEGEESDDWANTMVLPFVMLVEEDGTGRYKTLPDAENPFEIVFILSEDGKKVTVSHTGEMPVSCDGEYEFVDSSLEVSEASATAILDHLPTAATSLDHNKGNYTIVYPDELIDNWFYPVDARFDDTGAVLARFLIAKDLSAVYRVDDDIEPVLIFGSAQPMLDAIVLVEYAEDFYDEIESEEETPEIEYYEKYLITVELVQGTAFTVGSISPLAAYVPGQLPYEIEAYSSAPEVLSVDENGVAEALAIGEADIFGTIRIFDGQRDFMIHLYVDEKYGSDTDLTGGGLVSQGETTGKVPGYDASDYWGVIGWYCEGEDDSMLLLTFHRDGKWDCMDGNYNFISEGEYTVSDGIATMTDTDGVNTYAHIPENGSLVWSVEEGDIIFSLL